MKNHLENGGYLKGEKGSVPELGVAALATIALLYFADPAFHRKARTAINEPEFPQGGYTEYKPVAEKFRMVYEGQQEPKCPGDIEKAVPIFNKAGEIRGLNVICKPGVGEAAK